MGLDGTGTIPTEEAIRILVKSYKSSERSQEVQKEVAILSEKVPLILNIPIKFFMQNLLIIKLRLPLI